MRSTSAAPFDNVKQFAADNRAARLPTEPEPRAKRRGASGAIAAWSACVAISLRRDERDW